MSQLVKGIVVGVVCGLIMGAFLGSVFLGHESVLTVTTTEYLTSYASTITATPTFTISKPFVAPSASSFNVSNCSTLANYFAAFKNPIIVANYNYYIYRLPSENLSSLPDFNGTATRILSNEVIRTSSFPLFVDTTYFWSVTKPQSWQVMKCP